MRFDLPASTRDFAAELRKLAATLTDVSDTATYDALAELGALDVLAVDAADPVNREVNTVVVLEELATAGVSGPFAATMWARATLPQAREVGGFVAAPTAMSDAGERLVPYGARCGHVVTEQRGATRLVPLTATRLADIKVEKGHAWVRLPEEGRSFDEWAAPFAWRAAAASTLGHMEWALARAVEYAQTREQFKRTIGSFQAVQFRLAECRWRLSGLQLLVREAAWRADRGDPRAEPISALAWLHARTVGRTVTAQVQQVFGAVGFTEELGLVKATGATTMLRMTVSTERAVTTVRQSRAPVGDQPHSTVLAGFTSG